MGVSLHTAAAETSSVNSLITTTGRRGKGGGRMTRVFFFRGQERGGGREGGQARGLRKFCYFLLLAGEKISFFVPDIFIDMVLETRSI